MTARPSRPSRPQRPQGSRGTGRTALPGRTELPATGKKAERLLDRRRRKQPGSPGRVTVL